MQIDWWTLALQAVNFLVLIWLLWRFLYRPVNAVIEKRKQLAEQSFAEADEKGQAAEATRRQLESERAGIAQERQDMLKSVHDELDGERRKLKADAKREADAMLAAARDTITVERQAALDEIRDHAVELASALAATILEKSDGAVSNDTVLERLETQLDNLPPAELDHLRTGLAADSAHLTVVTAAALTADEQARWTARLGRRLGPADKIEFTVDPEILGGAELRLPQAVLRFSWADQLRKAANLLRQDEHAA